MTMTRCPHCGEALSEGEPRLSGARTPSIDVSSSWETDPASTASSSGNIDVFSISNDADHGFEPFDAPAVPQRDAWWRRQGFLAAAVLVAAAAVVGSSLLGGSTSPPAAPTPDRSSAGFQNGLGASTGVGPDLIGPNDSIALTPRPLDAVNDAAIAGVFRNLGRIDQNDYAITYRSADGLEVLQEVGRQTVQPVSVARFDEVLGFPLLVDGTRTWALSAEDPVETYIAAHSNVLVNTGFEGSYVFLAADATGQVRAGITSQGVSGPLFDLPTDAELLPVQGLGVLFRPATGGTFLIAGLRPELFSDGRVLAATTSAWLEQQCVDGIDCSLTVNYFDQTAAVTVDLDPNAEFSLSPDGRWVVRVPASGVPTLLDLSTAEEITVDSNVRDVAWAPDSSFFAWIEGDRLAAFTPPGTLIKHKLVAEPASSALLVTERGVLDG